MTRIQVWSKEFLAIVFEGGSVLEFCNIYIYWSGASGINSWSIFIPRIDKMQLPYTVNPLCHSSDWRKGSIHRTVSVDPPHPLIEVEDAQELADQEHVAVAIGWAIWCHWKDTWVCCSAPRPEGIFCIWVCCCKNQKGSCNQWQALH